MKKSTLSFFLILSVLAVSFPFQTLAQSYTSNFLLADSRVIQDLVSAPGFNSRIDGELTNGKELWYPPVVESPDRSYLRERIFLKQSGTLMCGNTPSAATVSYTAGILLPANEIGTGCNPPSDAVHTSIVPGVPGQSSILQTYDLPITLGDYEKIISVDSIPGDPNNVRVTESNTNPVQENYVIRFQRVGDVYGSWNGDFAWADPENFLYYNGKTYQMHWSTDWYGNGTWYPDYGYYCGGWRCDLAVAPTLTKSTITPAPTSFSVVRPRNSDVMDVIGPRCNDSWAGETLIRQCFAVGAAADGRVGSAFSNQSQDYGDNWLGDAITLGGALIGAALTFGTGAPALFSTITELASSAGITAGGISAISGASTGLSVVNAATVLFAASALSIMQAISSPAVLGTVETSNSLGVGNWTWSPLQTPSLTPPIVTPPIVEGDACTSAANACGKTNSGTIQHDGSCSATAPPDADCFSPDLTAGATAATPVSDEIEPSIAGHPVSFSAAVSNIGAGAASSFPSIFQITNNDMTATIAMVDASGGVSSLSPNASTGIAGAYAFSSPGAYKVRACANENSLWSGSIPESNADNNCGDWTPLIVIACATSLTANPDIVEQGQNTVLSWLVTGGALCASYCTGSGFNTGGATSGTGSPPSPPSPPSTSYALSCVAGPYGPPPPANVTVTVLVPTVDITVNKQPRNARVNPTIPNNVTVAWSSENAASCTITKNGVEWRTGLASAGVSDTVTAQTVYAIDCINHFGAHAISSTGDSGNPNSVIVNILPAFEEF